MRRTVIACVAALAAAVSIGALGYAVLWAFDLSRLTQPVMQQQSPPDAKQVAQDEAKRPAPRRRPLIVVAPRVPGEDARAAASPAAHAVPVGFAMIGAPVPAADEPSRLVAQAPPPAPPAPGEDAPVVAVSVRASAVSPAAGPRAQENTEAVSALIPQSAASAPPPPTIQAPASGPAAARPDPEPTGAIHPAPFRLGKPRVIQIPREREEAVSAPPGVTIIRGMAQAPRGVTIIRGIPPVPEASPGIVRPGPLIIQVPSSARR